MLSTYLITSTDNMYFTSLLHYFLLHCKLILSAIVLFCVSYLVTGHDNAADNLEFAWHLEPENAIIQVFLGYLCY